MVYSKTLYKTRGVSPVNGVWGTVDPEVDVALDILYNPRLRDPAR